MYCVIQNTSCQPGFSTAALRFDLMFYDEDTQVMQDMPTLILTFTQAHTHERQRPHGHWLTCCDRCNLSSQYCWLTDAFR